MRDLGLSYEEAAHGVQSAVRFEMTEKGIPDENQDAVLNMLKHLRTGVDMRAADAFALSSLLIDKGIITIEEYLETVRMAANDELARYEERIRTTYNMPDGMKFR